MPAIPALARGARITGWGAALPDKIVTNDDLDASGLETTDAWIRERTGIHQRHVGGSTASLSVESVAWPSRPGVDPSEIDMLILATTTPDQTVPATPCTCRPSWACAAGRST